LTDIEAHLEGMAPLHRMHENPAAQIAPDPPTASTVGWKNILHLDYDQFGNVTLARGAGSPASCITIDYDAPFAQFASAVHAHKDGCTSASLDTTRIFDRGLELPIRVFDPTGGMSIIEYDGFGRPIVVRIPQPDAPANATVIALALSYFDGA